MQTSSSKLYASALAVLGVLVLWSVAQIFVRGSFLLHVPGAGVGLHVMHWFGLVASPLGRLVIGVMLLAIAVQYFRGRLIVPVSRVAAAGKVFAAIGLFAGIAFFAWQIFVHSQGPQASIFVYFGPANFWISFLCAGVGLVEGSRILDVARTG